MPRFAFVNGQYLPHEAATIHVEDRGYQFADGVYEVVPVLMGRLVDEGPHLDRLDRSLRELTIRRPMSRNAMGLVMRELLRRNRVRHGLLYVQITRGVAPRNHMFPNDRVKPSFIMTTTQKTPPRRGNAIAGISVRTMPDLRWKRCDIKSISLLPNVLAKQEARATGSTEAWLVGDDGLVTEGSSSNAWIVTQNDELITPRATTAILNGITRNAVIALAGRAGLTFIERAFSVQEAQNAREAFITSSSNLVMPVVRVDDVQIADEKPGPVAIQLRDLYLKQALTKPGAIVMSSVSLSLPSAILFDWDDTLVDNWQTITAALNAAYGAFDMPSVSVSEAKRRATRSIRDSFPRIFGEDWQRARRIFLDRFAAEHIAGLEIKAGAVALLAMIREAGLPIAVVSNKTGDFLRAEADHLGWTPWFNALIGAGDAEADKPDPAVITPALAGTGLLPNQNVWLVGDTPVDMECAAAAGCTGVRIRWNNDPEPATQGENCAVASLHELQALVSATLGSI